MRLMLGHENEPDLLVEVEDHYDSRVFKFWVVNGAWEGIFDHGKLFVIDHYDNQPVSHTAMILCDNQDRLRGNYQDVFCNFKNENYVTPMHRRISFDDIDDDIPF